MHEHLIKQECLKILKGHNFETKKMGASILLRRPDLIRIPIKLHEEIPHSY